MITNLRIPYKDERYKEFFHCLFSELNYITEESDLDYAVIERDIKRGYNEEMAEQIKNNCNKPPAPISENVSWSTGYNMVKRAIFRYASCVFREIKKDVTNKRNRSPTKY